MLVWSIISFFQVLFIPGYIFLSIFYHRNLSLLQTLIYSIGLSLYINYQIVLSLSYFKLYNELSVIIILVIEILIIISIELKNNKIKNLLSSISDLPNLYTRNRIIFNISMAVLLFYFALFIVNLGSVYYYNDAIMSWNRWAVEWAVNQFPGKTGYYPQLLPTNMSIFYILTGSTQLSLLTKSFMPILFIQVLLIFLDLAISRRNNLFLYGLIIYGMTMPFLYSFIFIADGNTEITVSMYGFLFFYHIYSQEKDKFNLDGILLATIFASAAALTKLAGVYLVPLLLLWLFWQLIKFHQVITPKKILVTIILVALVLVSSLAWYLFNHMEEGLGQSSYLASGYIDRLFNALNMLSGSLSLYLLLFFSAGIFFSLFDSFSKKISLIFVIPILLIWIFFYSYDTRNLNISLPFIALVTPFGFKYIMKIIRVPFFDDNSVKTPINLYNNKFFVLLLLMIIFFISSLDSTLLWFEKLNKILRIYLFDNFRINYTVEISYYRYIEYFVDSIKVFCIILIGYLVLKRLKINFKFIFLIIFLNLIVLNFTLLSKEYLENKQVFEEELISIRNISKLSQIYSTPSKGRIILTDYPKINKLKFDYEMAYVFVSNFSEEQVDNNEYSFLLAYKKAEQNYPIDSEQFSVLYENESFIFFKRLY